MAISAPERLPGVATPTLKEQGINLEFINWRGVLAQSGIKAAEKKQLEHMVAAAVASAEWKKILGERGWLDMYQPADQFAAFLQEDSAKIEGVLKAIGLVQ